MTPVDRLRIEKAAADCGFEMIPVVRDDGLELRSARFPESVVVRPMGETSFRVIPTSVALLDNVDSDGTVIVEGYGALYDTLRAAAAHARTLPNRVADLFSQETCALPRSTEAERLVVQRVGQGLFRDALLDYWQGRCCVTGLEVPELLRASHIKPWAECESDDERLDVFNGLLLAPHIDALFDGGWVSFSDDGRFLVSDALPSGALTKLGVDHSCVIRNLRPGHLPYLAFHRKHQLRKGV